MSDLYGVKKYGQSLYKRDQGAGDLYANPSGGLSQTERETIPYLRQELAKQEEEKSWLTPLELVFDLLSRPQYITANVGQDIAEGKGLDKILEGAWKGLTGERKGDWKTTFFGGKDVGEETAGSGWFPGQTWAKGKIPVLGDIPIVKNIAGTWEDAIGLLGNILLDPTTYMTFGLKSGATAANKAQARFAAKEMMKDAIFRSGNLDEVAKVAKKGFDRGTLDNLLKRGAMDKAEKYIQQHVSKKAMATLNNRIYKQTFKDALQMTGKEFVEKLTRGAAEGSTEVLEKASSEFAEHGMKGLKYNINQLEKLNPGNRLMDNYKQFIKISDELPVEKIKTIYKDIMEQAAEGTINAGKVLGPSFDRFSDFMKTINRYQSPEFAKEVAFLGQRKVADFFGKEIGKGFRSPNILARESEKLKALIGRSPIGTFGRAVAAKLDGPIGWLKKTLNIKNPYQQMLNQMKMESHYYVDQLIHDNINAVRHITESVDEKTLDVVKDIMVIADRKKSKGYIDIMTDPEVSKLLATKGADAKKVGSALNQLNELTNDFFLKESDAAARGLLVEYTPVANYLPVRGQVASKKIPTREIGPFAPGFTKHKTIPFEMIAQQDQAFIKHFLGVDDATAKKITEMGWSTVNMDLEQMLMYRAHAHARAMGTAQMAEQFAQFGVKADALTANSDVLASLGRAGENALSGVRQIQTEIPALKGMYFDEDVANILDRIVPVISSDKGLTGLRKIMSYLTTMFKGWATFSPGFTGRNEKSNIITGFINYGAKFLHPVKYFDSKIVAMYGLFGEEGAKKIISKLGISDIRFNKILNKTIGGKSYKQWADDVLKKNGIVSKASMGYNLEEAITEIGGKKSMLKRLDPFNPKNIYFEKAQNFNAVFESGARVEGFLIDLEKMAGKTGEASQGMVDEAIRNVKKYFFDYEDLSEVEQKYLKKIIPFYSWIRKNIALQMHQLAERPGVMATIAKTEKAMQDEDQAELPDWARGQAGNLIYKTAEGIGRTFFPDLPHKDINQIPLMFDVEGGVPIPKMQWADAWDNFLSMAHPIFKTATTLSGKGWDPFKKKQLDADAPAPRAFRLLGKNRGVFAFLDSVFRVAGFENGLGIKVDDKTGKITMNAQAAKLLEDNFLLLRRLDDLGDTLTTIFPQIDDELEKLTGLKGRYDDAQRLMKTMSFALGISQRDIDLEKQNEYEFRDALRRAEERRREDARKVPGSQKRSTDYMRRYQKKIRRMRGASGYR